MEKRLDEPLNPFSFDECGQSGGEVEDSDEDVITDYHIPVLGEMLPRTGGQGQAGGVGPGLGGPLPTISVTPHSPANKTYPVLEDSLQQVRELHESVQRMREATVQSASFGQTPKDFAAFALNPLLAQVARLSASCPILNEQVPEAEVVGGSLGSSPVHNAPSRKGSGAHDWLLGSGLAPEPQRRKSWTALEDLSGTKDKLKTRQRSISSSGESEADESSLLDNVDGSTARLLGTDPALVGRRSHRGSTGGSSTHSLNEADLQKDFNKIKAKREAEQLRLLPARLPLQKSVSTPSIIAVRDLAPEGALGGAQPTLPVARPSGTESETEEELSRSGHTHFDPHSIALLHHVPYDHHSEKRRKRGSLFFRKKKDKNKKAASHQWVSPVCGSSQLCDVCSKPLSNKPALCCDNCGTTVHQNTCKDNIAECNKPKGSKNTNKISGLVGPLTTSKSSLSKRGSGSMPSQSQSSSTRRSQLCYSPWRRVATKLGVNQILSDDKEADHGHHDNTNFPDDIPIVPLEFLRDTPLTAADLCADPNLGLHVNEPDTWTPHVGKDVARKLKEKEVKRQEHIYEFVMTEKHHCMTLLVMQKIFSDGLHKYFSLGPDLDRMFPRLVDLIDIHFEFLSKLRQRQREAPIVSSIADILLEQFSAQHSARLKSAYGEFCSRHRDAVKLYKSYLRDPRFGQFVSHCQNNPLLKKKGIPECILFVTQRLTKYPLLIEPLIKTSKENRQEQETLQKALAHIKEILVEVDSQVAEKEKEERKLEIYYRIDAKSYTIHRGYKFKKSDILQGNRALRFEGVAMLMQGRGKMQVVMVIVLSDVLFFLQENSHNKYTFFTPDNKAGVISLQKLLVREKAGQESRGIYLISSNPADPEMFELKVHKPKDKQVWIQAIRSAVQSCPEDDESNFTLSTEEKQTLLNAKQNQIRHVVGLLRQKDVEQALLLEEKMALQIRLLTAAGLEPPSPPSYRHLVGENVDPNQVWREVLTAVQEVSHLASSLYTTGTNLSRSVSSVGEHQSNTYVSPILPKRAETFGGFDQNSGGIKLLGKKLQSSGGTPTLSPDLENLKPGDAKIFEKLPWRNCQITGAPNLTNGNTPVNEVPQAAHPDLPALLSLGKEQQYAAVQLSHYVYTLLCIISQLMTSNETLQAHLGTLKGGGDSKLYRHNQQLEELRNLQDKLSVEKTAWAAAREQETKELEEKKAELLKLQEQIRAEQTDIKQQREQLYRKMEILTSQGLLISPNVALPVTGQLDDNSSNQSSEESSPSQSEGSGTASVGGILSYSSGSERRKETKWLKGTNKSQLPQHLISANNQQKVPQNIQIKQQLPLKLATKLSSGVSVSQTQSGHNQQSGPQQILPLKLSQDEKVRRTSTSGYQRLGSGSRSPTSGESTPTTPHSHSRTGSSPAMMQGSPSHPPQGGAKAVRTHTYPKLPDEYKVKADVAQNTEEEVMYF